MEDGTLLRLLPPGGVPFWREQSFVLEAKKGGAIMALPFSHAFLFLRNRQPATRSRFVGDSQAQVKGQEFPLTLTPFWSIP
jgi:hypothetical protein